jgi:hypothetical protein
MRNILHDQQTLCRHLLFLGCKYSTVCSNPEIKHLCEVIGLRVVSRLAQGAIIIPSPILSYSFEGPGYSTPWWAYSQAAVTQMPSLPARSPLTPGWGEKIEAKRLTQSLTPTAGFEPGTSRLLVRDLNLKLAKVHNLGLWWSCQHIYFKQELAGE